MVNPSYTQDNKGAAKEREMQSEEARVSNEIVLKRFNAKRADTNRNVGCWCLGQIGFISFLFMWNLGGDVLNLKWRVRRVSGEVLGAIASVLLLVRFTAPLL